MRVLLIILLVAFVSPGPSTSEDAFEEKLKEGYNQLKSMPNEDDTVRFLKQLHKMEGEIKNELAQSPQQLPSELMSYTEATRDHIQPMGDSIEEVNQKSKVDAALFQGDMILTRKQTEELLEDIKASGDNRNKRQAFRDSRYPKTLWTNKNVYYSHGSNATEAAKRVFKKAAALWSAETCISFGESNTATDRILLIQASGCWSYVGRIGGVQALSLGQGCESVGVAAHELGHALGFYHTQSRHDRDDFITLSVENFLDGWISQFSKQTEKTNYNYNLTYDYGSVMHYGATSVSKNGKPVMVPRDIKYLRTLGSPIISFYEKLMMNLHYGCLDRCNGSSSSATCQNGGFPHPRDCSKCICPSGYAGKLCNERPSGCGTILTATKDFQTLEDTVGERGAKTATDEYTTCNYWIQAPAGATIEVAFDNFTRGHDLDGCSYAGVEIKTGSDIRHTGYRLCASNNVSTTLISTRNIVPVITYTRLYQVKTILRYRIASSGPATETTSRPISGSTTGPTPQPPTPTSPTVSPPNPQCKDSDVCTTLMTWNFCTSAKYDDELRKLICPKSCGFCC